MAVKTIYEILDDYSVAASTPDFTTTTFDLRPQNVLVEEGRRNQIIHTGEDDSEEVIILANTPVFYVTLQWSLLTPTNAGTVYEFYYDVGKGNGFARSFIWIHPKDGVSKPYKVRFATPVPRDIKTNHQSIPSIDLKILGLSDRCYAGLHTGSNNSSVLIDSTKNWETNALKGLKLYNILDGGSGEIDSNTSNTVTATLIGGVQNDWDTNETYRISNT